MSHVTLLIETVPPAGLAKSVKWLVISPHSDDAALSIGGLLLKFFEKVDLYLLTLTRGPFDDAASSWTIRLIEDRLFASHLSAVHLQGDILDGRLRGGGSAPVIRHPSTEEVSDFRFVIENWLNRLMPDVVLLPLGIGGHVDHLATVESMLDLLTARLALKNVLKTFFYEDLPYSALDSEALPKRLSQLQQRGLRFAPDLINIGRHLDQKLKNIDIFSSQHPTRWHDPVRSYAMSLCGTGSESERLWKTFEERCT